MKKIAVMTDSNSGISKELAEKMGIAVLPMPFYLNDVMYYENETLTREQFFKSQRENVEIKTSQPLMGDLIECWDKLLKEYDQIIFIPMSSGLSGTCASACAFAQEYENKVFVVDNQRISVPQKQSVLDAVEMIKAGLSAGQIKKELEDRKFETTIYIMVDTLEYLKKGGRITTAAAAFGTVFNVKPVLTIQGEKLDSFAKVRGIKSAKKKMIEALEIELQNKFSAYPAEELCLQAAYTCEEDVAEEWKKDLMEHFQMQCDMDPLPLSISCHVGPGAIGAAFTRKYTL